MSLSRQAEIDKYARAYAEPRYKMGRSRTAAVTEILSGIPLRGSLVDVGTGRGETLDIAFNLGFVLSHGVEVVPDLVDGERVFYATATELPFDAGGYEVVTCFDVLEHLLPDATMPALAEMRRVAGAYVALSAANWPSRRGDDDLHINIREYDEWDSLIREAFDGWRVDRLGHVGGYPGEFWLCAFDKAPA